MTDLRPGDIVDITIPLESPDHIYKISAECEVEYVSEDKSHVALSVVVASSLLAQWDVKVRERGTA